MFFQVHKLVETEVTKDAVPVETFKDERVLEYIFSGSASTQARGQDSVPISMMGKGSKQGFQYVV